MTAPDANAIAVRWGHAALRAGIDDDAGIYGTNGNADASDQIELFGPHAVLGTADDVVAKAPKFSEEYLALSFASDHSDDLRYVAAWAKWLQYENGCWRRDDTLLGFDLVRKLCRSVAIEQTRRRALKIASASTVSAIERLARSDRRLAATVEQWDAACWLLNTPDGVVDLKTGAMRQSKPTDYSTKITAVGPGSECPLWLEFLRRVTDGDEALLSFMQRAMGYALTGSTQEDALFFFYGTGANGKSVFIKTISGIFGDYHRVAPVETFISSTNDRHPTDIAHLHGARLATSVETEEGRYWDESRLKNLTGGDRIPARFMRQDFWEFTPQFKLLIAGNHKPRLRSVDEAWRRRFHLVPFRVTIPPDQRDQSLSQRLRQEWPGIFKWMIDGCLDWQQGGLSPPTAVTEATATYLKAEDTIGAWIVEQCEVDPNYFALSGEIFACWKAWAERTGERTGTQKGLTEKLVDRGFRRHRIGGGTRGLAGLRLRPQ